MRWLNSNVLGLGLLAVGFAASIFQIFSKEREFSEPGKTILRICHWQLELGYRDALEKVIAEYQKLHPNVKVVQMPVTERLYPQWLNVQLISREAPDLCEMGMNKFTQDDTYMVRFFLPLSDIVEKPNPYNRGTELEGVPWRETFIDGMRGGYRESLQDYYSVPTTTAAMRFFYNKDLLRRATGSDRPPQTFGQLLDVCAKVKEYGRRTGELYIPILSNYQVGPFIDPYLTAFTAGLEPQVDFDLDGVISRLDTHAGFVRGMLSMDMPEVRGFYELMKALCDNMAPGFAGMDRQQAQWYFVQGRGAFLATGSWDGESIYQQALEAGFPVGVIPFPIPAKGERWGDQVIGKRNEANAQGIGPYGVYKFSRNQAVAIDFLHFLTSRKYNEMFNQEAGWPPVTIGAQAKELMKPFQPDPTGYNTRIYFDINPQVDLVWKGQQARFLSGEIPYETLAAEYTRAVFNEGYGGDRAWGQEYDRRMRECRDQERVLAVQACRIIYGLDARDAPAKYRKVLVQQVTRNNGQDLRARFNELRPGKPMPEP